MIYHMTIQYITVYTYYYYYYSPIIVITPIIPIYLLRSFSVTTYNKYTIYKTNCNNKKISNRVTQKDFHLYNNDIAIIFNYNV